MLKVEADLISEAKMVLDFNWTGEYTKPGPRLYPHQWSWDSALIAIGYSHYDQGRATRALTHLFDAQWSNGLLPQIVFNPHFGRYFPGIDFWHAYENPRACYELGRKSHRNADFTVSLVPSRSLFPAFLSRF